MKKRIINFGEIQLFGAVGEWGLVLTDLAGATVNGLPSCHSIPISYDNNCFKQHKLLDLGSRFLIHTFQNPS